MKQLARITRIENGIVYCKIVNPFGENIPNRFDNKYYEANNFDLNRWRKDIQEWQQAESERKELPLDDNNTGFINDQIILMCHGHVIPFAIGDEIEVIEQDNKFKIV